MKKTWITANFTMSKDKDNHLAQCAIAGQTPLRLRVAYRRIETAVSTDGRKA